MEENDPLQSCRLARPQALATLRIIQPRAAYAEAARCCCGGCHDTSSFEPCGATRHFEQPCYANLGDIARQVIRSAALGADLGAMSIDSAELVMAIEDEFKIEISDECAAAVVTVDDLERLIIRPQATQQQSIAA
jgi:acyl carrier protein